MFSFFLQGSVEDTSKICLSEIQSQTQMYNIMIYCVKNMVFGTNCWLSQCMYNITQKWKKGLITRYFRPTTYPVLMHLVSVRSS